MTVKGTRPRGRLLALAGITMLALAAADGSAAAATMSSSPLNLGVRMISSDSSVQVVAPVLGNRMLLAGPLPPSDGGFSTQTAIELRDATSGAQVGSYQLGPVSFGVRNPDVTVLDDGSIEMLGDDQAPDLTLSEVVVRLGPTGRVNVQGLPKWPSPLYAEAIGADGSVWQALACNGQIARIGADGHVHRYRVPTASCRVGVFDTAAEFVSSLTIGTDGSAWLVNRCIGRIARIPLVGKQQHWSLPANRQACTPPPLGAAGMWSVSPVEPDSDGGITFPGGRITGAGKLRRGSFVVPDATTGDGGSWTIGDESMTERRDGKTALALNGLAAGAPFQEVLSWAVGPDRRLWYTGGFPNDSSSGGWFSPTVGVLGGAGTPASVAYPTLIPNSADPTNPRFLQAAPPIAPASDGSVWVGGEPVIRVESAPGLASARPRARASRLLARSGASQWVQMTCSGRPGTFCTGTARLAGKRGRAVAGAAKYVIPGGEQRPVALTLRAAARRVLKRSALRATAVVTGGGQRASRAAVRLAGPPKKAKKPAHVKKA